MRSEIPTAQEEYAKVVGQVSLRMQASADFYLGKRDKMSRCWDAWHKYPSRPTAASEEDDYAIQLGYGFGVLEQVVAKITEPLLNMGVPFAVMPNDFGDQSASDNAFDMNRDRYTKPHFLMGKRRSKKEMAITGTRFEIDEWLHIEEPGTTWGEKEVIVEQPVLDEETGQPVVDPTTGKPGVMAMTQKVVAEVPTKITTFYGVNTRFPRTQDIYPEPDRSTIDTGQPTDIAWYVEDWSDLAIEDLARQVVYDPATKTTRRRFDFSKLIADQGEPAKKRYANILSGAEGGLVPDSYGPLITPVHDWTDGSAQSQKRQKDAANQTFEDRDKVWVVQMRMKNEIVTIANGKYIIERVLDPWHRPRLGLRVEVYTLDPRSLFGISALDPILDELDELNITHSLGMQNLFRLINKMVAVKEKAIVSMDDLDSRSGGIVRVNDEVESAAQALAFIPTPSAINEMLAGESAIKGNMEFVTSQMDGSPGVAGTKQQHKTKGGMDVLRANLDTRFATMQSQGLINEALGAQSLEYLTLQFMWDPVSYEHLMDDGATVYKKFTKDDIDTKGRGLKYVIQVDPLWGNNQAQRQDAQEVVQLLIEYEKLRLEMKDPKMKRANISLSMERLLKTHGYRDLSRLFAMPSGEVDPDQEMMLLSRGVTEVECRGDLIEHSKRHFQQAMSPGLQKAMAAGKADPKTAERLLALHEMCNKKLAYFLRNPAARAQEEVQRVGMALPGPMGQA